MRKKFAVILALVPILCFSQEFNFTQEWDSIPVSFDGVECQVPWTTGYNYINPTFCDIDGDDDFDLFFGSDWNRQTYLENVGNASQCSFEFRADAVVNVEVPVPASQITSNLDFVDIDGDGDYDLFIGTAYSGIPERPFLFYENIGTPSSFEFEFREENFQNIYLQNESKPVFVDIDNDGDYDLFLGLNFGATATTGKLMFYQNDGTPDSASMVLISNFFMGIDLGNNNKPAFCDIDADGDYDMFLGDGDGIIHYYRNDGNPEVYNFTEVPGAYAGIELGEVASPTFCDLDGDGDFDLFVGERSWGSDYRRGDIDYYQNVGTPDSADFQLITYNFVSLDIGFIAAPAFGDIDNDGLIDMFVGEIDANMNYFSNVGSPSAPSFNFVTDTFQNVTGYYQSRPCLGDLDNDDDLDMLVGKSSGVPGIKFYINEGTPEIPYFVEHEEYDIDIGIAIPSPELVDIDNDGDLDLFVGHYDNRAIYYENIGTPENFRFQFVDSSYFNTLPNFGYMFSFCFGDLDNDGDYDMIRDHNDEYPDSAFSKYDFYRNIGTPENPSFILEDDDFLGIRFVIRGEPYLVDIDNDNDLDLFIGGTCGGISFWRNNEFNSVVGIRSSVVSSFTLYQNYPNPFNASTVTSFKLQVSSKVNLMVYDVLGREVTALFTGYLSAGEHSVVWDASGVGSGVYLVRLSTLQRAGTLQHSVIKTMLVK